MTSQHAHADGSLIAVIGDEDTVTGFLLAGIGSVDLRRNTNFLVVNEKTTVKQIEETFRQFTTSRDDIAIVLINQSVANLIRHQLDTFREATPAILEIPSKSEPYDPSKDSILSRVKFMSGEG